MIKARQSRKASTQPLQRPKRPGHAAADSPGAKVRPPASPVDRRGMLTSGSPCTPAARAALAYPSGPSPRAPAARRRAAGAGGHRPSARALPRRDAARGRPGWPGRLRASRLRDSCKSPGRRSPPPRSGVAGLCTGTKLRAKRAPPRPPQEAPRRPRPPLPPPPGKPHRS